MSENLKKSAVVLNDDERMEYTEIGQFYRHADTIAYQLASVLLPLLSAPLPLPHSFLKY